MPTMEGQSDQASTGGALGVVADPKRLAALAAVGLFDTPVDPAFDRLARLASRVLHTPAALVTFVGKDKQFFKSCIGLPEPWSSWRQTPMSHSFCQHVVISRAPLAIEDARVHPLVRDNPAITALNVIAYLGIPLIDSDGNALGSFCVIDATPRRWNPDEINTLVDLAGSVMTEIRLQSAHNALRHAHEELKNFVSSVTHDLRGPTNAIAGFSSALMEDFQAKLDAEGREFLQRINASAQRMGVLLDDLLEFSCAGTVPLKQSHVDLSEVVRGILAELESVKDGGRRALSIQPNVTAEGDAHLIGIALENLLSNAWKFTARTPDASIAFGTIEENGKTKYFVRDNGAGFDMALVSKLFEPFQRLHSSTEFQGTGVGLATVRRIIERHGGEISAEGAPGHGATFKFTLGRP
jgi:signal transduction histidine kinase